MSKKILVLGALGQIGTDLVDALRLRFGVESVIASDIRRPAHVSEGIFVEIDAKDRESMRKAVVEHGITEVYHLVAMLSATAEKHPIAGWDLNMISLFNVLELAKEGLLKKVFWPSSIAAFGPTSPKDPCDQTVVMDPATVYGISKLSGELWCSYYFEKYGVDVRSVRYPGLISWKAEPGGGTTDYAVDIFHKALAQDKYTCYIAPESSLPMMYMEDAIESTIGIMEAKAEDVRIRTSYNIAAFSVNPRILAEEIQKHRPNFEIRYDIDFRDVIAQGWPASMLDKEAREHWGHNPKFDLSKMTEEMLARLAK